MISEDGYHSTRGSSYASLRLYGRATYAVSRMWLPWFVQPQTVKHMAALMAWFVVSQWVVDGEGTCSSSQDTLWLSRL